MSRTLEIPIKRSPSRRLISRTPWVVRPITRTSLTGERTACPDFVNIIISSSSATLRAPATIRVFIAMIPVPPRFWTRYSSKTVRLPMPFVPAMRRVLSGSTTSMAFTSSLPLKRIPMTPLVTRPCFRRSSSWKRTDWPLRVTSMRVSSPRVRRTVSSSSSSSILMPLVPMRRKFL